MIPTEHEGTVAVDAAARNVYASHLEKQRRWADAKGTRHEGVLVEFDDLDPTMRNRWREAVLPTVWAALEALPGRPRFPAGLFVDLDAEREPCVWQAAPAVGVTDPQLVARRCDVTPTAWAILEAAAEVPA